MAEYRFKDSPFPVKKTQETFRVLPLDFSGTEWEGSEEFVAMAKTIAGRFAAMYGNHVFDDIFSGLLLYLRDIARKYDPEKGSKRAFYMTSLGLQARHINSRRRIREKKQQELSKEPIPCRAYRIEDVQLRLDFNKLSQVLNQDEIWFLEAHYNYGGELHEIKKKWEETRERISLSTISRRIEDALTKILEDMRVWKTS